MDIQTILAELESLGSERLKKNYIGQGAHEPLFGVATGAMKPPGIQAQICALLMARSQLPVSV